MVGCQSVKFDKSILYAADTALVSFGEFWDGGLSVESICQHLVFFRRPRLAVIGGNIGCNTIVLWLWDCSGCLRLRGWRLALFRRLSRFGVLLARKVRDEQFDFVAKTVEIGRDCVGLESVRMSGGIANDGDYSDGANQDGRQGVREAVDGGMETSLCCWVVLP